MRAGTMLLGAAVVGIATFALQAPALAQEKGESSPSGEAASSRDADRQVLEALLKRRAELLQSTSTADKRPALEFLDAMIAEVRSRIAR